MSSIDFQSLVEQSDLRQLSNQEIIPQSLPADGKRLLNDIARRFPSHQAAWVRGDHFSENLELTSYSAASSSWYANRKIAMLVWKGDLVVDADLIDDDFALLPVLVVHGNLTVRSWLRGGMPSFIGGTVHASGFIVGHYNDSALFIGGELNAAGYLPRAKPYPDLPKMAPHQIAGTINARQLNLLEASEQDFRTALVDDVLLEDDDGVWIDERAILERAGQGATVWKQ